MPFKKKDEFQSGGATSFLQSAVIATPAIAGIGGAFLFRGGATTPSAGMVSAAASASATATTVAAEGLIPKVLEVANTQAAAKAAAGPPPFVESLLSSLTANLSNVDDKVIAERYRIAKQSLKYSAVSIDPLLLKKSPGFSRLLSKVATTPLEQKAWLQQLEASTRAGMGITGMDALLGRFSDFTQAYLGANASGKPLNLVDSPHVIPQGTQITPTGPINQFFEAIKIKGLSNKGAHFFNTKLGGITSLYIGVPGLSKDLNLQVPHSQGGLFAEGLTGQTIRAGGSYTVLQDGKLVNMSSENFLLHEFQRGILPRVGNTLSPGGIERATKALYHDVIQSADVVNNPRTANARNKSWKNRFLVPTTVEEQAKLIEQGMGITSYREPTPKEQRELIAKSWKQGNPVYAFTSPTSLSRTILSSQDLGNTMIIKGTTDYSFRLDQINRPWRSGDPGHRYSKLQSPEMKSLYAGEGSPPPRYKTLYLDPDAPEVIEWRNKVKIQEGEVIGRKSTIGAHPWIIDDKIDLVAKTENLETMFQGKTSAEMHGQVIGVSAKTNRPVKWNKDWELGEIEKLSSASKGDFTRVNFQKKKTLGNIEHFFSTAFRGGLMRLEEDKKIFEMTDQLILRGRNMREVMIQEGYDAISFMGKGKQYRMLHVDDMAGMLYTSLARRDVNSLHGSGKRFIQNPIEMGNKIMQSILKKHGGVFTEEAHKDITSAFMAIARKSNVSEREMGGIFGSVPQIFGKTADVIGGILDKAGYKTAGTMQEKTRALRVSNAITEGWGGGLPLYQYAGPAARNVRGSIEPRVIQSLEQGPMGKFGKEAAQDLMERLALSDPGRVAVNQDVRKTLSSFGGAVAEGEIKLNLADLTPGNVKEEFKQFVEAGGGYMRVGGKEGDVFVPGNESIRTMREYSTRGGQNVKSSFYRLYEDIAEAGVKAHLPGAPENAFEELTSKMDQIRASLWKEVAPAGKGAGSLTRGKINSTRYLEGISEAGDWIKFREADGEVKAGWVKADAPTDLYTVGVSKGKARQMFKEMKSLGVLSEKEASQMWAQLKKGEDVTGLLMRHPNIGPFSQQVVRARLVAGNHDNIVIPSAEANIFGKKMRLGVLPGLGGDFDSDTYFFSFFRKRQQEKAKKLLTKQGNEYMTQHVSHQVRSQLLRAKNAENTLSSIIDNVIAGTAQKGTTQQFVPQMSVALSEVKAAIRSNKSLSSERKMNAYALAEQFEQAPVGHKWISGTAAREGAVESTFKRFIAATNLTGSERMGAEITNIAEDLFAGLKDTGDVSADELRRGKAIPVDAKTRQTMIDAGIPAHAIPNEIAPVNIKQGSSDMAESLGTFRKPGRLGQSSLAKWYRAATGRLGGKVSDKQVKSLLTKMEGKEGKRLASSGTGMMAGLASRAMAIDNAVMAAGGRINPRTLAIGLGASMAIAAVLSSPPKNNIKNQDVIKARMSVARATDKMGSPTEIAEGITGNPTVSKMFNQVRSYVAPAERPQMHIRARGPQRLSGPQISDRIRMATNSRTNVNTFVRDDRASPLDRQIAGNR